MEARHEKVNGLTTEIRRKWGGKKKRCRKRGGGRSKTRKKLEIFDTKGGAWAKR